MTQTTIQINWYGPYTIEHLEEKCPDEGYGLYLFTGKRKYQRTDSQIQYFGITEQPFLNRFKNHHKLSEINRDLGIWLGYICYPEEFDRNHLEIAESMLIYFWQPELNEKKKISTPNPTIIISHWFKPDGTPRFNQMSIYKNLHDVISWDGNHWRTGNLNVYE